MDIDYDRRGSMIVRQKRNRKIIGKIKISACVFVFAILAGGCAKKAENINLNCRDGVGGTV